MRAIFIGILLSISGPSAALAFDLLTDHAPIRPESAPDGLVYCLSKGHAAYVVPKGWEATEAPLPAERMPVENLKRKDVVLIGGLMPVSGTDVPETGRRLLIRSIGWVDHLICVKGVPI